MLHIEGECTKGKNLIDIFSPKLIDLLDGWFVLIIDEIINKISPVC